MKFEYKRTRATVNVGDEVLDFTVANRINQNGCKAFMDIVVNKVFKAGYMPWMFSVACDFAALTLYTDINVEKIGAENVYDFINTTDIIKVVEQVCDIEQLSMLRVSARQLVDYYLKAALEKNTTLGKLNDVLDKIGEFANNLAALRLNDATVAKITALASKLDGTNDGKIIDYVMENKV